MKMKVHLYGKRIHLKGCKYADLVNVDTFDFKHCIVVENGWFWYILDISIK